MTTLTPTTELEAVNAMLTNIGGTPINSLLDDKDEDVSVAVQVLNEVSREIQSQGWHFNKFFDYPLTPDQNNEIVLPGNALSVDLNPAKYPAKDVIERARKLFDKAKNSSIFTETLEVEIVFFYAFEELPETARRYITLRASRIFENRTTKSAEGDSFASRDELAAKARFERDQALNKDTNIVRFRRPSLFRR